MPRRAPRIEVSQEDKIILSNRANSRIMPKQMVDRAKMILDSETGKPVNQIAQELNTYPNKVIYWRQKYVENGMAGLRDNPRSGRPKKYGGNFRNDLLKVLSKPPPKGLAIWDGPAAAKVLGAPVDAVWKVLRIQALERKTGYIKTDSGQVIRAYKSTYKRHGTLNLFAALEVATGKIQGKVTQEKKRTDFQAFMDEIVDEYASDQEIHVVLDNYCTHKKKDEWLARNKNVHFHFTPTSASWLNQVEIWFGIFSRKALRGASFTSPQKLRRRIKDFIERYNPDSKPFKWRKRDVKGAQLKHNIVNLIS